MWETSFSIQFCDGWLARIHLSSMPFFFPQANSPTSSSHYLRARLLPLPLLPPTGLLQHGSWSGHTKYISDRTIPLSQTHSPRSSQFGMKSCANQAPQHGESGARLRLTRPLWEEETWDWRKSKETALSFRALPAEDPSAAASTYVGRL